MCSGSYSLPDTIDTSCHPAYLNTTCMINAIFFPTLVARVYNVFFQDARVARWDIVMCPLSRSMDWFVAAVRAMCCTRSEQ
jgi:hypothetical protein